MQLKSGFFIEISKINSLFAGGNFGLDSLEGRNPDLHLPPGEVWNEGSHCSLSNLYKKLRIIMDQIVEIYGLSNQRLSIHHRDA